jgi:class 3 adenylate cyclase
LFDSAAITGEDLLGLLSRLCAKYQKFFEIRIEKILSSKIQTGLTFGIESGPLVEIRMNESDEYFGRALNVAARLQGAARTLDSPQGKLLLSRNAFDKLRLLGLKKTFPATSVRVDLRNLFDGDSYSAKVIVLHK